MFYGQSFEHSYINVLPGSDHLEYLFQSFKCEIMNMDGNYTFLFVSPAVETESKTRGNVKTNGKTNSEFSTKTPHLPWTQVETVKIWKMGKILSLYMFLESWEIWKYDKGKYRLWSVATLGVPGSMSRPLFSSRDQLLLPSISVAPDKFNCDLINNF